jgi:GxxExxY protein
MHYQELKYKELTRKIIGCAMQVHSYFGIGFREIVYKRALLIELKKLGLECKEELEKENLYQGKLIYRRELEFLSRRLF